MEFEVFAERFTKRFRHLLENNQAIEDGEVAARRDGVQIVAIVLRLRREIAEVYVLH